MTRTAQEDPLKNFNYHIEIDNFARFGFSKASGLKQTTNVIEYGEGGQNATTQKSPGKTSFDNLTFERGVIIFPGQGQDDIVEWATQVFDVSSRQAGSSNLFRRTIHVVQFSKTGLEARRWEVVQAWACGTGAFSDLEFKGDDNSVETLIVCHEGYRLLPSPVQL